MDLVFLGCFFLSSFLSMAFSVIGNSYLTQCYISRRYIQITKSFMALHIADLRPIVIKIIDWFACSFVLNEIVSNINVKNEAKMWKKNKKKYWALKRIYILHKICSIEVITEMSILWSFIFSFHFISFHLYLFVCFIFIRCRNRCNKIIVHHTKKETYCTYIMRTERTWTIVEFVYFATAWTE